VSALRSFWSLFSRSCKSIQPLDYQ